MIRFTVYGKPVPKGSMKPFYNKHLGYSILQDGNKNLKPWRQEISGAAMALSAQPFAKGVALAMSLDFFFERPKSVSRKRVFPTVKPDVDKLIRTILDSLKGILYNDDAQVVRFDHVEKHYGIPERVEVVVREIGGIPIA